MNCESCKSPVQSASGVAFKWCGICGRPVSHLPREEAIGATMPSGRKKEDQMAYRATCPHGQAVLLTADRPDMQAENAREIAACIRAGFTIDRITAEEARKSNFGCEVCH